MGFIDGARFDRLERSLDATSLRQQVIANNVANVDVPGYKRSEVKFEELLHKEMNSLQAPTVSAYRTHHKHFEIASPAPNGPTAQVVVDHSTAMNNNLNNVDIDYEMSLMAKNQLKYNTLVQEVSHHIQLIKTAIGGR